MSKNIFDEMNLDFDPFKVLGITKKSNNETIKEAYKLKRQKVSPSQKEIVERSFNMVKNEQLRCRYRLLENRPYNSLDDIKAFGFKPIKTETNRWVSLISNGDSKS